MTSIQEYSNGALLSDAAYANFNFNLKAENDAENDIVKGNIKKALETRNFTPAQADDFMAKYEVAHHHATDDTGLSFTVFKEKDGGELTLAIRGTDNFGDDLHLSNLEGSYFAIEQSVSLYNEIARLTAKGGENITQYQPHVYW